jgi:ppGpp synthetase/RelA/SpoT-type nucleotidyltranferase
MNEVRYVEDLLRAEYVALLPSMQRILTQIETEVRYALLPLTLPLDRYERVLVRGRLKECESAVDALRRRQEGGTFVPEEPERYSLTSLPDLVGVRVLTFPRRHFEAVRGLLSPMTDSWTADPLDGPSPTDLPVALKYDGFRNPADAVRVEIQIVSLLVGLFWEVEHAAIYKPSPSLRGVEKSPAMQARTAAVLTALRDFEEEFDRQIDDAQAARIPPTPR